MYQKYMGYKKHKDSFFISDSVGRKTHFTSTDCVVARPVVKTRAELYTLTFTLALHSHLHIYHLASFCMHKNRRSKNSSAVTHFPTSFFSFNIPQYFPPMLTEDPFMLVYICLVLFCIHTTLCSSGPEQWLSPPALVPLPAKAPSICLGQN